MIRAPSSAKYIKSIATKLLLPVKRGESAFVRWSPGHGKTALIKQIFSDNSILENNLGHYWKRFIFVNLDGFIFNESDLEEFLIYTSQTLHEEIENKVKLFPKFKNGRLLKGSPILTIKRIADLCSLAINEGLEIVFIIDSIDGFSEQILKQLFIAFENIIENNRERVHTHINVNKGDILENSGLQSGIIQNIITIPLPDKQELQNFIEYYKRKWGLVIDEELRKEIVKYCGCDPVLIKESLRIIANKSDKKEIFNEPTLLLKAKINFGQYSAFEKLTVEEIARTGRFSPLQKRAAKELMEGNFLTENFCVPIIYEQMVLEHGEIKELIYDKLNQTLFFGSVNLSKKLSPTEYKIINKLYAKFGKTVSRDEIAEIIWGDNLFDQYSDWAIDKAVSRLREKLSRIAFHYQITTRKKEGFLLEI